MAKQSNKPYKIGGQSYEHFYKNAARASYDQKPSESAGSYYRRLAKQANQRMVRLEQLSQQEGFQSVTKYAYAKFEREALALSGGKSKRFKETELKTLNEAQIRERTNVIKQFLQSPTSTKGDIVKMYKERANTINEVYNTSFTWETLAKYFESGLYDTLKAKFESDGAMDVIAQIQKQPKEIIDNFNNTDKMIEIIPDDIAREAVQDALKANKVDIKEFFDME